MEHDRNEWYDLLQVEQSRFVVQPFMMAPSPEASSETAAASMLKGKTSRQLKPLYAASLSLVAPSL